MSCQPVRVHWDKAPAPLPFWTLAVWCDGCQRYRKANIAASVATNVELAERFEADVLAELHAP